MRAAPHTTSTVVTAASAKDPSSWVVAAREMKLTVPNGLQARKASGDCRNGKDRSHVLRQTLADRVTRNVV